MAADDFVTLEWDEARALLGVSAEAGEAEVRAAYLEKVRQHPPDREPELFERIRDAHEQLRNPVVRARRVLSGPDPTAPLASLLEGMKPQRRFVGAQIWLEALKEKRP
jgi:DnaJ-class molecular chaperone